MKIVTRREHEGAWWGRARDGAWFRWSTALAGWEGPFDPPWTYSGGEEASEPTAGAGWAQPPRTDPRNRVDAWWNRAFPPFSIRRLVFGLVALTVIAALLELALAAFGRDPSLPRFLFVCLAGGAVLASAWLPGMRKYAKALARDRSRPATRDHAPAETSPLPRTSFSKDFLLALPFSFVIVLIVHLVTAGPGETFTGPALAVVVVASTVAAVMVASRSSVWSLVLFSALGGLLGGFFVVFLSLMTFSGTSWIEFAGGWILGSIVLFSYAYPVWRGLRNMEARGVRLPMLIVMAGSVVLVSGAALMFLAER